MTGRYGGSEGISGRVELSGDTQKGRKGFESGCNSNVEDWIHKHKSQFAGKER